MRCTRINSGISELGIYQLFAQFRVCTLGVLSEMMSNLSTWAQFEHELSNQLPAISSHNEYFNFIFNCVTCLVKFKNFLLRLLVYADETQRYFLGERATALAVRVITAIISEVCIDTRVKINCTNKLGPRLRRGFTFTSCSSLAQSNSYLITLGSATEFNVASPNGGCERQSVNGSLLTVIGYRLHCITERTKSHAQLLPSAVRVYNRCATSRTANWIECRCLAVSWARSSACATRRANRFEHADCFHS